MDKAGDPLAIPPVTSDKAMPFWSVMIPTYNPRRDYLEQALSSVLSQDPGKDRMQIEVVDDCSTGQDVANLVRPIAGDRVTFSTTPSNLGLAGCWNTCVERSVGTWVHILHQDDYVLPGFYERLESLSSTNSQVGLIAARSMLVGADGVIEGVTERIRGLEHGSKDAHELYYESPARCPGIIVRREFYERHGGFRSDLKFTLDYEMWTRVISTSGGLATAEVLAAYRQASGNETSRLIRTGEAFEDYSRLHRLYAQRYGDFDIKRANRNICGTALSYSKRLEQLGDQDAARACFNFWKKNSTLKQKVRHFIGSAVRRVSG
jgi:glycosyltransferase involved in cell wall biosynthesis